MRVGIIGAGAAGLCAARQASITPQLEELVVFEQSRTVGGTWVYTPETGKDSYGLPIHSSMYKNMRTNLPKEVMGFPDFPFTNTPPASFISHQDVKAYLDRYTDFFQLRKFIKFESVVRNLRKVDGVWRIKSENLATKENSISNCDVVFVCNGHYAQPKIPDIKGKDKFKGAVVHSHNYRDPEPFRDKKVLCLGAGPSGIDIAIELATVCQQVYLCHRKAKIESYLPENIQQVLCGIEEFQSSSEVLMEDGSVLHVDAVMYCTGYLYQFPFLDESTQITVASTGISPLYQHLLFTLDPTLVFPGLCQTICPFPNFHVQISYALAVLQNPKLLPTTREMLEWEQKDRKRRLDSASIPKSNFHFLGGMQWDYLKELSALGGLDHPIPPVTQKLYDEIHRYRMLNLVTYKDENFRIRNDFDFYKP